MAVLYVCLINWLVTTILVESHLFAPVREWVVGESWHTFVGGAWHKIGNKHWFTFPEDATEADVDKAKATNTMRGPWFKLAQLVSCQLCVRVWVGFAEAFVFGGPFAGRWYQFLADGLLYAAGGHLILELRSRIALREPVALVSEND